MESDVLPIRSSVQDVGKEEGDDIGQGCDLVCDREAVIQAESSADVCHGQGEGLVAQCKSPHSRRIRY